MSAETDNSQLFEANKKAHQAGEECRKAREDVDKLLARVERLEQECARMKVAFREWRDDRK